MASKRSQRRRVKRKQEWHRGYLAAWKDEKKGYDPEYRPKEREKGGKW